MSVITTVDIFERHSVRSVKVDYLGSKEVDLGIDFFRKSGFGLRLFLQIRRCPTVYLKRGYIIYNLISISLEIFNIFLIPLKKNITVIQKNERRLYSHIIFF